MKYLFWIKLKKMYNNSLNKDKPIWLHVFAIVWFNLYHISTIFEPRNIFYHNRMCWLTILISNFVFCWFAYLFEYLKIFIKTCKTHHFKIDRLMNVSTSFSMGVTSLNLAHKAVFSLKTMMHLNSRWSWKTWFFSVCKR